MSISRTTLMGSIGYPLIVVVVGMLLTWTLGMASDVKVLQSQMSQQVKVEGQLATVKQEVQKHSVLLARIQTQQQMQTKQLDRILSHLSNGPRPR